MTQEYGSNNTGKKLSCRDWFVFFTFPCLTMLLTYYNFTLGGLLPLIQKEFNKTDAQIAMIKTFGALAHSSAFTGMWLFGDFLPKKPPFLLSIALWILFGFASVLVSSNRFWVFVLLRSLSTVSAEVFRILITVLQADHFTGKYLTLALTANIIGNSLSVILSSTINSTFVANNFEWRFAIVISSTFSIPCLITFMFVLRNTRRIPFSNPMSIIRNAFGVFRIPSYVLLVIGQCITMFYSISLTFWSSSMLLNAFDAYPAVFLGLSYPAVSSLTSIIVFVSMLVGADALPFLSQFIEGGYCCFSPTLLAIPLIYASSVALESFSYIDQVITISRSLPLYLASYALDGFAGCGVQLMQQQLVLITTPTSQRTSALALLQLIIALGEMPSAQIIGAISDYFRGDSTLPADRLASLQSAFTYTWILPVISTIMSLMVLRFYKKDVNIAKEIDESNNDETAPLLTEKFSDF